MALFYITIHALSHAQLIQQSLMETHAKHVKVLAFNAQVLKLSALCVMRVLIYLDKAVKQNVLMDMSQDWVYVNSYVLKVVHMITYLMKVVNYFAILSLVILIMEPAHLLVVL